MRNTWKDLSILHLGICWNIKDATWKTIWLSCWFQPIRKIWVKLHYIIFPPIQMFMVQTSKKFLEITMSTIQDLQPQTSDPQISRQNNPSRTRRKMYATCYPQIPRGLPTWWLKKSNKNTNIHNINIHFWKYGEMFHQCHLSMVGYVWTHI